jgi:hypothetical protein
MLVYYRCDLFDEYGGGVVLNRPFAKGQKCRHNTRNIANLAYEGINDRHDCIDFPPVAVRKPRRATCEFDRNEQKEVNKLRRVKSIELALIVPRRAPYAILKDLPEARFQQGNGPRRNFFCIKDARRRDPIDERMDEGCSCLVIESEDWIEHAPLCFILLQMQRDLGQ